MGFGKSFKKAWKKTFGWTEKAAPYVIGGVVGGTLYNQFRDSMKAQERMVQAQIDSAEKIAEMQNATVVSAAPPQQTVENEEMVEENNATKKARAFRLANSVRGNTLGGGSSSSNKKRTLG